MQAVSPEDWHVSNVRVTLEMDEIRLLLRDKWLRGSITIFQSQTISANEHIKSRVKRARTHVNVFGRKTLWIDVILLLPRCKTLKNESVCQFLLLTRKQC